MNRVALRGQLVEFDILLATALIWFLGQFVRYTFPPLFELFQRAYGVSNTTLGAMFTLLMLMYASMQFPSGALGDRIGMTQVITAGVGVLSAAALVLFASQTFPVLIAVMAVIGLGTGAHKTVAINLLSVVYPLRTARTLGVMDAIGQLGGMVAPAVVVFVLSIAVGWHVIFLFVGVAGIVLAAVFVTRIRHRPALTAPHGMHSESPPLALRGYLASFTDTRFVLFAVVAVIFTFVWSGVSAFLPLYLINAKGLSATTAGLLYSVVFFVSLIQPLTGAAADRVGRLPIALITLVVATTSLGVLLVASELSLVIGIIAVLGLGIHGFRPARDAFLVETIPDDVAGGTLGIVRTIMMILGSAAPTVVGTIADIASFTAAFAVLAITLGLGAIGVAVLLVTPDGVSSGL